MAIFIVGFIGASWGLLCGFIIGSDYEAGKRASRKFKDK
jgi:hypothetical protein